MLSLISSNLHCGAKRRSTPNQSGYGNQPSTIQDIIDLIASKSVHNVYESIEDFGQKTDIQLPEDIAAMLTQPQD